MPTPCAPAIKAFRRAYPSEWRSRSTLRAHRNQRRYTNPILFHNNEKVETRGDYTDLFFEAATKFIDRSLHAKKPFWAYIAPNAPHRSSHDVPEALYQKYLKKDLGSIMMDDAVSRDDLARILARIENVDANIGRLMDQLERRGIARDTIVILLNDNGPNSRYFVGLYRGRKSEVHDGGVRSSLWVGWPARLKPGATSDLVSAHYDIMPTILDAAGVNLPRDVAVDGRSLLPLLEQEPINWPDRDLYLQSHRGNEPEPEFGDERRSAGVGQARLRRLGIRWWWINSSAA